MTTRKHLTAIMVGHSLLAMATTHATGTGQQPGDAFVAVNAVGILPPPALQNNHDSTLLSGRVDSGVFKASRMQAPQIRMNPAAAKFVADYIKKNSEVLQQVEQRSEPVFRIMEPILLKYDLPVELKYLAVVESDLKRTAVSRVGAAGPWQLMPVTARELGLKVTRKWDERKHFYKSTTAAALYLRDLYRVYEDWLLVIAAYNAGPGVVNKAIKRAGSRNFWKLQAFLPAETRGHVKRFIGTHYFFEAAGSITTLTKAETKVYEEALNRFASQQEHNIQKLNTSLACDGEVTQ